MRVLPVRPSSSWQQPLHRPDALCARLARSQRLCRPAASRRGLPAHCAALPACSYRARPRARVVAALSGTALHWGRRHRRSGAPRPLRPNFAGLQRRGGPERVILVWPLFRWQQPLHSSDAPGARSPRTMRAPPPAAKRNGALARGAGAPTGSRHARPPHCGPCYPPVAAPRCHYLCEPGQRRGHDRRPRYEASRQPELAHSGR